MSKCEFENDCEYVGRLQELESENKQLHNEIDDLRNTIAEQFEFEKLIESVEYNELVRAYQKLSPAKQKQVIEYISFVKHSRK